MLGAKVYANADKEIGWFPVEMTEQAQLSNLFTAFPARLDVFHWHGDTIDIPQGAVHVVHCAGCAHQAFVYEQRVIGLQFHLETTPASARQINTHCADEIVEGRYIQTPQAMLGDLQRFDAISQAIWGLLDRLAEDGTAQNTQKAALQDEDHITRQDMDVPDAVFRDIASRDAMSTILLVFPTMGKKISVRPRNRFLKIAIFCSGEKESETGGVGLDFCSSSLSAMSCCFSCSSSASLESIVEIPRNISPLRY